MYIDVMEYEGDPGLLPQEIGDCSYYEVDD